MVRIKESLSQIQKSVNKALARIINALLPKAANKIEPKIKEVVRSALLESPEIQSLKSGTLKFEFGLDGDPTNQIVDAIVSSLEVRISKVDKNLKGGFYVYMQPTSYANLVNLSIAQQKTEKGVNLPWLKWLLTLGDSIIVANFGVEFGPGTGRSGGATMSEDFRPYKVNSAYSGTIDNNFITRAIDRVSPQIRSIIKGAF